MPNRRKKDTSTSKVEDNSENVLIVDLDIPPVSPTSSVPSLSSCSSLNLVSTSSAATSSTIPGFDSCPSNLSEQSVSRKEWMHCLSLPQLVEAFVFFENEMRQTLTRHMASLGSHAGILNDHHRCINDHAEYIKTNYGNQATTINQMQSQINDIQDKLNSDSQAAIIIEQQKRIQELEGRIRELEIGRAEADRVNGEVNNLNATQQDIENKIKAIEETVKVSRTWAEVVKDPSRVISQAMTEHERRATKALNIRVRGVQFESEQGDLLKAAQTYIKTTFAIPETSVVAAWKGKYHPSLMFMRFKDEISRLQVLRKRSCLKGTNQFIDEDLTPIQWNERKKCFAEAKSKNQRVIFRDGRPIYISNSNLGSG